MLLAAIAIFTSSFLTAQDPVTITNPPLQESLSEPQNLDGLLLVAPVKLTKQAATSPDFTSYLGQVITDSAIKQVISVVITDLAKIDPRPTPEQVCDLHDRASRTRQGSAGQLFKSERTTINGKPMVVLIGSLISRDTNQKAINLYQTSAAFSTETKAYEITWITVDGGAAIADAIKSVRNASLQIEDKIIRPQLLVGTIGNYTLLGTPLNFLLPAPVEALPDTKVNLEQSGRYIGELTGKDWFATAEIAVYKSAVTDTTPQNLLKLLGYEKWLENKPEFKLENNIYTCSDFPITETRHARIDIAIREKIICAVIISADNDKPLPQRDQIALTP
jgi:hypothetical protein